MDPVTGALSVYHSGQFEPYTSKAGPLPVAASSMEKQQEPELKWTMFGTK
jgi:hypothetical protein